MCDTVHVENRDYKELETPRQLLNEIPNLVFVLYDDTEALSLDECLCPVDLMATFKYNNIGASEGMNEVYINIDKV